MNEIRNQIATANSQSATPAVTDVAEPVRTAGKTIDNAILTGPNIEVTVAMMGVEAALQTARNFGVSPKQAAERRRREAERRKEDDLKEDQGDELAAEELERERQVTENLVAAGTMSIRA